MGKFIPEKLKRTIRILRSFFTALMLGFPSRKLVLVGVTGTSGKSTTSNLIYHILDSAGYKAGIISTVGAKAGSRTIDTGLHVTTPDPEDLQKLLATMVKKNVEIVVVEASSHALAQGRLGFLKFDVVVFTNIRRDHLDWHKTWENYANAKAMLIDKTKKEGHIVINRGDRDAYDFLSNYIKKNKFEDRNVLTYALSEAINVEETAIGTRFGIDDEEYRLSLLGSYNVENALAAMNVAMIIGLNQKQIANGLSSFIGLEGRMQIIQPTPFTVIVDFAHNTDSLEKSLISARKLAGIKGRVITVFGSAGLRDVEKRYTMGETSARLSDITVVTSEDPRTERLFDINSQILEGSERAGGKLAQRFLNTEDFENYEINPTLINKGDVFIFDEESVSSRYDAIEFACRIARPGDVVITEGKGHEQSLCFGTTEYPFTDQQAVEKALEKIKFQK